MDPNTANPRVVVSEDNTQLYTLEDSQDIPDHPGRYDVVLATLGSTGYSTGRHYWEANVANQPCYHIGFASGSAQRKGILKFKPETGYWTIILNKQSQFRALDKVPVALQVLTPPLILGVLLDYKKGQVSFYDAGNRSHIYSFTGHMFTDELYPFINFCTEVTNNPTPIVLISPGPTDWL